MEPQPPNTTPGQGKEDASKSQQAPSSPPPNTPPNNPIPTPPPPPPKFMRRVLFLCLRPETWAEMGQYRFSAVLFPLIFVLIFSNLAATAAQALRQLNQLQNFAATYDKHYPPMELSSDGILSVKGELQSPVRVPFFRGAILVDPTGHTKPESGVTERTPVLITDKQMVVKIITSDSLIYIPISDLAMYGLIQLPEKDTVTKVNGAAIGEFVHRKIPMALASAFMGAVLLMVGEAVWVILMMFIVGPLIILVAAAGGGGEDVRRKTPILPFTRRIAYRMAAGFMVPLVLVSAILRGADSPVSDILGPDLPMLFWFAAASSLAIWTGVMARRRG